MVSVFAIQASVSWKLAGRIQMNINTKIPISAIRILHQAGMGTKNSV